MLGLSSEGLVVISEVEETITGHQTSATAQRTESDPRWWQIRRRLSRLWARGEAGLGLGLGFVRVDVAGDTTPLRTKRSEGGGLESRAACLASGIVRIQRTLGHAQGRVAHHRPHFRVSAIPEQGEDGLVVAATAGV